MRYWSPFTTPIKSCYHTLQGSQTVNASVRLPFECTLTKTWATLCLLYPLFSHIENYVQQHYQQHSDADDKKAARTIAKAFPNNPITIVGEILPLNKQTRLPFECTFSKTSVTLCLLYPFFSYIENYVQQHYQQHNDADDKKAARAIAKAFQNFHGTVVLALTVQYWD